MLRRVPSKLLLLAGLAPGFLASRADAQVLARAVDRLSPAAEAACPGGNCQPHALTYGFYRESWRRWPEGPTEDAITPEPPAKSKIDAVEKGPVGEIPEPRDEASSTRRKRPGSASAPMTTSPLPASDGTDRGSSSAPAAEVPSAKDDDSLPDSLPDAEPTSPSSPSDASTDGGFFPSVEPGADATPTTPDADLPAESVPDAAPAPSDSKTPADDSLDLEDFSQVNPDRARRYHGERRSVYRQAASRSSSAGGREASRKATRKTVVRHEEPADELADDAVANPLRRRSAAAADTADERPATTRSRRGSNAKTSVATKATRGSRVAQVSAAEEELAEDEVVPAEFIADESEEEADEIDLASAEEEVTADELVDAEELDEAAEEEEEVVEVRPAKTTKKRTTRSIPVAKKQPVRRASSTSTKVTAASLKTDGANKDANTRRPATRVNPLRQRSAS